MDFPFDDQSSIRHPKAFRRALLQWMREDPQLWASFSQFVVQKLWKALLEEAPQIAEEVTKGTAPAGGNREPESRRAPRAKKDTAPVVLSEFSMAEGLLNWVGVFTAPSRAVASGLVLDVTLAALAGLNVVTFRRAFEYPPGAVTADLEGLWDRLNDALSYRRRVN